MPKKRFSEKQIAFALRQADAGTTIGETCPWIGVECCPPEREDRRPKLAPCARVVEDFPSWGEDGRAGMKGVDTIARVRREFFVRGRSIKEICRELHISRNTVRKILRSDETAFVYERTRPAAAEDRDHGGRSWTGSSPGTRRGRGGSG